MVGGNCVVCCATCVFECDSLYELDAFLIADERAFSEAQFRAERLALAIGDAVIGEEPRAFEVVERPAFGTVVATGQVVGQAFDGAVAGLAGAVVGGRVGRRIQRRDAMLRQKGARVVGGEGAAVVGLQDQRRAMLGEQGA